MSDTLDPLSRSGATVSLADEKNVQDIIQSTILGLWEVVNNLTRLRPSRHDNYRVTIFGSSRVQPDSELYNQVRRLARDLADLNCDIITGGGPGLMQAANEGAADVRAAHNVRSIGIRVDLPFEQGVNPFVESAFSHRTFFTRLHHFVMLSDAFVVVPGGIGTVLETTMIWQLLQVRHLYQMPLILVGPMWPEFVDWARRHMLAPRPPLANPEDMLIPRCVATTDEALALIKEYQARWRGSEDGADS